jgi:SAM-dependent methyltransferase
MTAAVAPIRSARDMKDENYWESSLGQYSESAGRPRDNYILRSILFRGSSDDHPLVVADLCDHGTLGIADESQGFRAFFSTGADISAVLSKHSELIVETRVETEAPLTGFSREDWDPVVVGERFIIAPSWVDLSATEGRLRLSIDATTAFGTGRHESTQLAIRALERHVTSGMTVVDVGCGSGILSAAALALGARTAIACDVHPDAVHTARRHLESPLFLGSVDALRDCSADLVIANISKRIIDALAADLNRIAAPGALLVLAGFLEENPPGHFSPEEVMNLDGWACWVCRAMAESRSCPDQQHRLRSDAEYWHSPT